MIGVQYTYLLPFEINDFVEMLELFQIKSMVLILRATVESFEDAHNLPLSYNMHDKDNNNITIHYQSDDIVNSHK